MAQTASDFMTPATNATKTSLGQQQHWGNGSVSSHRQQMAFFERRSLSREHSLSPSQSPRMATTKFAFPLKYQRFAIGQVIGEAVETSDFEEPAYGHSSMAKTEDDQAVSSNQRRFSVADLAEAALRQQRARQQFRRSTGGHTAALLWADHWSEPPFQQQPAAAQFSQMLSRSLSREPSLVGSRRRLFSQSQKLQQQQQQMLRHQQQRAAWAAAARDQQCSKNNSRFFCSRLSSAGA